MEGLEHGYVQLFLLIEKILNLGLDFAGPCQCRGNMVEESTW